MSALVNYLSDLSLDDIMMIGAALFGLPIVFLIWLFLIKMLWYSIKNKIYDWDYMPRHMKERELKDR